MVKQAVTALAVVLSTAGLATAQEHRGAGRIEIGAIPIGGVTFMKSTDSTKPQFRNYTIGGTLIGNLTQWVGLEADVGVAVGRKQDLTFNGGVLSGQKTPNLWNYSGNLIINLTGRDHPVIPYIAGGIGGMRLNNSTDAASLGISTSHNYWTTDLGGGVRWFLVEHWGLRGDYRYYVIHTNTDNSQTFFDSASNRRAHRLTGSIVVTW